MSKPITTLNTTPGTPAMTPLDRTTTELLTKDMSEVDVLEVKVCVDLRRGSDDDDCSNPDEHGDHNRSSTTARNTRPYRLVVKSLAQTMAGILQTLRGEHGMPEHDQVWEELRREVIDILGKGGGGKDEKHGQEEQSSHHSKEDEEGKAGTAAVGPAAPLVEEVEEAPQRGFVKVGDKWFVKVGGQLLDKSFITGDDEDDEYIDET